MTKKFLLICIICLVICGLVSCDGISTFEKSEKVTEEEWLDAFDLSDVEKMTIDFEIKEKETFKESDDENEFQSKGTVVCENNVINANYTEISYGEEYEESWESEYDTLDFSYIEEIGLDGLVSEINYAYVLFEYSNDNGAYRYAMDMGEYIMYISVWFKDGNISKITFSADLEDEYMSASVAATYNFKY